jgi:hypothetical protein
MRAHQIIFWKIFEKILEINSAIILAASIIVNAAPGVLSSAQADDAGYAPPSYKHILNDHVFLPSLNISSPFADSTAEIGLGFAYGTYAVGTPNGNQNLSLGSFSPIVEAHIAIIDPLAITLQLNANAVVGLNDTSIINYGASTAYSYSFGAIYEINRTLNTVFSGNLTIRRPHTLAVSPLAAAESAVAEIEGISDPDYVQSTVQTQWRPTLRVAYAINPIVGIKSLAGFNFNSVASNTSSSTGTTKFLFDIGIDTNFNQLCGVPLGIEVGYNRNQILSTGSYNSNTISVGLFETLRKSFNAGFEIGKAYVNGLNATVGTLLIRTYYN